MHSNSRWGWWLLTIASIIWLLWMTLRPDSTLNQINLIPMAEHGRALACLVTGGCAHRSVIWFLLVDVLGNIVVFIPLGIGVAGIFCGDNLWQTFRRAALGGFLVSLTIELTQLAIPSRATDIDDLIFNTLGTMLGAIMFIAVQQKKLSISRS
jgi:glycopeptide antibiotics resistance protein